MIGPSGELELITTDSHLEPGPSTLPEVEDVGPDLESDPVTSDYKSRSRTTKWRFENKILEAANNDPDAVLGTAKRVLNQDKDNPAAASVIKQIIDDPSLGAPLAKYLKRMEKEMERMNDELNRDESGRISPISCLAYLLGSFPIPCLLNQKKYSLSLLDWVKS